MEGLLAVRWPDGSFDPAPLKDILEHVAAFEAPYAVVGTIALGLHARARFVRCVCMVSCSLPSRTWRSALSASGYKKKPHDLCTQAEVWAKDALQLFLVTSVEPRVVSACQHAEAHQLFGIEIRVATPADLLWTYLVSDQSLRALPEAAELINHASLDLKGLKFSLARSEPHLLTKLDDWLRRAHEQAQSSYSTSVARRLVARRGRPREGC